MVDTYKGESFAKKAVRLTFWIDVYRQVGHEAFHSGLHLVLASRAAGDVATLLGLGVRPERIIAVDREASAIAAIRCKWPIVQTFEGDVAAIARLQNRTLTSAYLDFCGPQSPKNFQIIADVVSFGLKDRGAIGYTFLAAREVGTANESVRREQQDMENDHSFIASQSGSDTADTYLKFKPFLGRLRPIYEGINRITLTRKTYIKPTSWVSYRSSTYDTHGVPMITGVGQVHRAPLSKTHGYFLKKTLPRGLSGPMPTGDLHSFSDRSPEEMVDWMVGFSETFPDASGHSWPLIFNVHPTQWESWKQEYAEGIT